VFAEFERPQIGMVQRGLALTLAVALGIFLVPLVTQAQPLPGNVPRIGVAISVLPSPNADALRRGLAELGWVEGRNILIEYRYTEGRQERYPAVIAELISLKVDVIVAGAGTAIVAKHATSTIPIVVPVVADPVAVGLVSSLARPGGNVTGLSMNNTEIITKRVELLREILPKVARMAVLRSSATDAAQMGATQATARSLGVRLQVLGAARPEELEGAFAAAKKGGAEALIVFTSAVFSTHRRRLVDLAAQNRLVAVYEHRDFPDAGGLMSYGPNITEMYRRAATYIDKILKGAKPADLPVEQPTAYQLVINLKTAKALGLTIPPVVLLRADQILE